MTLRGGLGGALSIAPVSCGECGDLGVDSAGEPCVCGGPNQIAQIAKLRRFKWWPMYNLEEARWEVYKILDDEADDRGMLLSDSPELDGYRSLESAVAQLCTG